MDTTGGGVRCCCRSRKLGGNWASRTRCCCVTSDTFERCKALREVDITGCEVTPSWFEALTACQSLKCLWVGEEFRHHSGVHTLMRALPRVHIRFAY